MATLRWRWTKNGDSSLAICLPVFRSGCIRRQGRVPGISMPQIFLWFQPTHINRREAKVLWFNTDWKSPGFICPEPPTQYPSEACNESSQAFQVCFQIKTHLTPRVLRGADWSSSFREWFLLTFAVWQYVWYTSGRHRQQLCTCVHLIGINTWMVWHRLIWFEKSDFWHVT